MLGRWPGYTQGVVNRDGEGTGQKKKMHDRVAFLWVDFSGSALKAEDNKRRRVAAGNCQQFAFA
jgi:hypothetical protein